jgi:ubiquitin carboxyl-terminal hydrolase 25/28
VGDFSDALLLFSYSRQAAVDPVNAPYYFECLQDIAIGRNSEELSTTVMTLASQGVSNRREVAAAYKYFGIEPAHAPVLQDNHIIGLFKSRLQDIGPAAVEESRKQLRIIAGARSSERIMQVSNDALETYEQALEWLGLDQNQADEFVITMYGIKIGDNAGDKETARKAVRLIATERGSKRLHDFLERGDMGEPSSLDIGEAYAIFNIADRAAPLSLDVLQGNMAVLIADLPSSEARYQQAYDMICEDQKKVYNNSQAQVNGPPRNTYQMSAWPVGLRNIGNTCYLNSVLQFLFTIKPLRDAVLDPNNFVGDLPPEELETKIVGRSAVRPEKLDKARMFVQELRSLLQHMITQPDYIVRPEEKLAALALVEKAESVDLKAIDSAGLGDIGGVPIAGPMLPPEAVPDTMVDRPTASLADSVMGSDDAKSDTSMTAMADEDDPPPLVPVSKPDPPSRPPPVPPRPQVPARTDANTMSKIELNATQQDAAEILQNIFDLLSCALIGTGTMPDGEQIDLIKSLFFTELTTVYSGGLEARKSAIQDAHHISPGWRNRPLYAALDDEFSKTEVEKDPKKETAKTSKYAYIERPSPIQIINVRRNLWEDGRQKKDYSQVVLPEELFLDRYLHKTNSLSENDMLKLREEQWGLQEQLREKDARKKLLTETEHKISLPDAVDEAADSIDNISKPSENQLIDVDADPIPRFQGLSDTLRERARKLREEMETLDQEMKELDKKINSLFDNCKDHPYRLHSVLMHRGSATGGHYFIYIYDAQVQRWRKYNDDRVDWVTVEEVFEHTATYPQTSTTIVYVSADKVHELTEAVHRQIPTSSTLLTPPPENEIEMKDADNYAIEGMQVIEGVEMKE